MPEQLLHRSQVRPVVKQVRREAVTQCVRADPGIQAGVDQVFVQLSSHAARAQWLAVLVEEAAAAVRALLAAAVQSAQVEVALDGLDRLAADGREAILSAFALYAEHAL